MKENRCVCCGAGIPEGRQTCPTCEANMEDIADSRSTSVYWKPEKTDDLALDDCPFCGCKEPLYEKHMTRSGPRWRIICPGCMAMIDPGYTQNRHAAQKMWNRRAIHG